MPRLSLVETSVEDVDSYALPALLTTIFCCMPFGIVALIYASKVNEAKEDDDLERALTASRAARKWCRIGIIVSGVINAVFLILQFLGAAGGR